MVGYLAGYFAEDRDMESPVAGYYGGRYDAVIVDIIKGYQKGVEIYNSQNQSHVKVEGEYGNSYSDKEEARDKSKNLIDVMGVDVMFPVAGRAGIGALEVAKESGIYGFGVDVDQYETLPELRDILISSCIKKLDSVVYRVSERFIYGFYDKKSVHIGDMSNGGVDIADYHDFRDSIPITVEIALKELKEKLRKHKIVF